MGRHSAHHQAPPATPQPLGRHRQAPPPPHWRRDRLVPTAAVVLAVCAAAIGGDALHLLNGVGQADALNRGAADVQGVDLSAIASGNQASLLTSGSQRVSRSSRTLTGNYTLQARPGLPAVIPGKIVPGSLGTTQRRRRIVLLLHALGRDARRHRPGRPDGLTDRGRR